MSATLTGIRQLFLSKPNTEYLTKMFYKLHSAENGQQAQSHFVTMVPLLMRKWKGLSISDLYESVNGDSLAEMQAMNKDFITEHRQHWKGHDARKVKLMPESVEGYRQLDFAPNSDTVVERKDYRGDNRPYLLQQKMHSRHYETKNDNLGIVQESHVRGYDMTDVIKTVDQPYKTVSTLDVDPNYDFELDSNTAMVSTN